MNYFQNLYLCDSQQLPLENWQTRLCCELLSKFVSLWLQTTPRSYDYRFIPLWITFKICIFVISTTHCLCSIYHSLLWITFKICTFVIWNNLTSFANFFSLVVDYLQNLYLCDFQQPTGVRWNSVSGCELLSKFVSLWLPTTVLRIIAFEYELWITFKICIFVTSNNSRSIFFSLVAVVNYFQNLYLCDFQQQRANKGTPLTRCELLSKFVSLWLPTTAPWNKES